MVCLQFTYRHPCNQATQAVYLCKYRFKSSSTAWVRWVHRCTIQVNCIQAMQHSRWRVEGFYLKADYHFFLEVSGVQKALWFHSSFSTECTNRNLKNTVSWNENDWIGLIIFVCFQHKKQLPDRTKITIVTWFCFVAFFKNIWLF